MSLPSSVKTFLVRFGAFAIPVLALLALLEYQLQILPNNYQAKEDYLLAARESVETISLGNSQVYMGVTPWALSQPAFNLANTAQMLTYDFELLNAYHKQLPALKQVILGISVPSLYTLGIDLPGDFNRTYRYKHFLGLDAQADPSTFKYYSIVNDLTIKKSVDRMVDYYSGADDLVEFDSLGWYTDSVQRDLDQNGIDAANSHNGHMRWEHKAYNLEQLEKIASLCQQHGYQLILFSPPMYQSYRENMNHDFYQDMVHSLDSFSTVHSILYHNFTVDSSYAAIDYFDSNHLRESGSIKLTKTLESFFAQP